MDLSTQVKVSGKYVKVLPGNAKALRPILLQMGGIWSATKKMWNFRDGVPAAFSLKKAEKVASPKKVSKKGSKTKKIPASDKQEVKRTVFGDKMPAEKKVSKKKKAPPVRSDRKIGLLAGLKYTERNGHIMKADIREYFLPFQVSREVLNSLSDLQSPILVVVTKQIFKEERVNSDGTEKSTGPLRIGFKHVFMAKAAIDFLWVEIGPEQVAWLKRKHEKPGNRKARKARSMTLKSVIVEGDNDYEPGSMTV